MAYRGGENGKLERRKTMTMNWAGLGEVEDDDDHFFDSSNRISSVVPLDLASSSDEEEGDFDDCRISFSSNVPSSSRAAPAPDMSPDYDIWMSAPGSITERRRRLRNGMGLESKKNMLGTISIQRVSEPTAAATAGGSSSGSRVAESKVEELDQNSSPVDQRVHRSPSMSVMLVRSRSDSDIEASSAEKTRKEDMLGKTPKSRLTRTTSAIGAPCARICPYFTQTQASPSNAPNGHQSRGQRNGVLLSSVVSNTQFSAFFLIKNLDTGKEFIVKEYGENGMWNRLSDLQTGKQLTMEEFEKTVGYSSVVKDLMRRENANSTLDFRKFNSYVSKSLRVSKKRGAALLKNIKGVAHSMSSSKVSEKEKDSNGGSSGTYSPKVAEKNSEQTSQWVKVRHSGKSHKDLSALHLCQEIQAHQGGIWTMKFSPDAHLLASAGEDCAIHVWEVQECEIMSMNEGSLTPIHPSMSGSTDKSSTEGDAAEMLPDKKKKGKGSMSRKGNQIPDYVHAPETVFSLSDKPVCSFTGHLDDVLDLSWSRSQLLLSSSMDKTVRLWDIETQSCLKLFAHNDYVTCVQFNPLDEDYFISGSLDAKIRIWNISNRQVVEWNDLKEMVTAVCYTPDGQAAFVGSINGNCRLYSAEDCKLDQTNHIDLQNKKKAQAKKITAFQFSPVNPSEMLVTSADSRIRILDGTELVQKFRGFKNVNSQMTASYTVDAKHIVCASEDSQVYVWKHEEPRLGITGRKTVNMCTSYETFPCKDVSVAVPWNGVVKGEPPSAQTQSKRNPKKTSTTQENATTNKKTGLPPLPKKNNEGTTDGATEQHQEDDPMTQIPQNESENNTGESLKHGDSPSLSISSRISSWSWFDSSGSHGAHAVQPTAWGMVIVTATIKGQIRAYQNFGLPRRVGRQGSLF
ncbi:PREDICTED: WD repeat-containing protein 44-like [Camelina sativa]|uniref:WD repeat-containing protein 44-like n=1 Tax=Camelina sativa TaxID=90675 RepID=A0ABM0V7D8_CAMSA|nr:PREDICTED: WD repeat-containing protein 44-like [Camelina sativa]